MRRTRCRWQRTGWRLNRTLARPTRPHRLPRRLRRFLIESIDYEAAKPKLDGLKKVKGHAC